MVKTAVKLLMIVTALVTFVPGTAAASTTQVTIARCNGSVYLPPGAEIFTWMPMYNGDVNCLMSQGAAGAPVYPLQYALIYCHRLNTGGYDGQYGPSTRTAVIAVQRANGIPADGVYGPQTKAVMLWPVFDVFGNLRSCGRVLW